MFKYAQKVFEKVSALKLSGTPNLFRYTSGMGTTKRKTSGSSFRPTSVGINCTAGDSLRSGSTVCSPHSKGISIATGESEATRTSISTSARVNSFPLQFFTNEIDNENLFLLLNPPLKKNLNIFKWFSCTLNIKDNTPENSSLWVSVFKVTSFALWHVSKLIDAGWLSRSCRHHKASVWSAPCESTVHDEATGAPSAREGETSGIAIRTSTELYISMLYLIH